MIDPKNWRKLQDDITTDALWISSVSTNNRPMFIIPKRGWNIENDSEFHGLFIPEIPYQFISRFCPDGGLVWDCFGGSGTTYRVVEWLNQNTDYTYRLKITDLNPKQEYIEFGDVVNYNVGEQCDVVMYHPPYKDIIVYSDDERDGSTIKDTSKFLEWVGCSADNIIPQLKKGGYLIIVCGNIYENSEEIDLGVYVKDEFVRRGMLCKSHIIKDYGETKGTAGRNYNVNYYRQLKGGYNNFYGDNIFILKKK